MLVPSQHLLSLPCRETGTVSGRRWPGLGPGPPVCQTGVGTVRLWDSKAAITSHSDSLRPGPPARASSFTAEPQLSDLPLSKKASAFTACSRVPVLGPSLCPSSSCFVGEETEAQGGPG